MTLSLAMQQRHVSPSLGLSAGGLSLVHPFLILSDSTVAELLDRHHLLSNRVYPALHCESFNLLYFIL